MNIVADLIARIEARLTETKNPCKLYASEAKAEQVAEEFAIELANYFSSEANPKPARYVAVFIPSVQKWTVGFDLTQVMSRPNAIGGYIGYASQKGFYTF